MIAIRTGEHDIAGVGRRHHRGGAEQLQCIRVEDGRGKRYCERQADQQGGLRRRGCHHRKKGLPGHRTNLCRLRKAPPQLGGHGPDHSKNPLDVSVTGDFGEPHTNRITVTITP